MIKTFLIFGVRHDDGNYSDSDEAIDRYYYWRIDEDGKWAKKWDERQSVVNKVKSGEVVCWTYPQEHLGARCEVKVSSRWIEYLKTVPNGDLNDNLSALPEM